MDVQDCKAKNRLGGLTEARQTLQQMRALSVLLPEFCSRLELMHLPLKRVFWGAQICCRKLTVGVRLPLLRMDTLSVKIDSHTAAPLLCKHQTRLS